MPPQACLVRHGETAWSLTGQHTGRTDLALTPKGEQEAGRLGARLAGLAFAHVWCSPRRRARQTCNLAGLGAAAETEPDLAEWDYGDYEGLRTTEIQQRSPGWDIYRDGCPHGESPAQVSARADRIIVRLRSQDGNVAAFSHGHFGRVLGARWIGLPVEGARHFVLGTASISILGFEHDDPTAPVIVRWNETADGR